MSMEMKCQSPLHSSILLIIYALQQRDILHSLLKYIKLKDELSKMVILKPNSHLIKMFNSPYQLILYVITFATLVLSKSYCPPLNGPKETNLTCKLPHDQQNIPCSSSWLPDGTIAHYECQIGKNDTHKRGQIKCKGKYGFGNKYPNNNMMEHLKKSLPCGIYEDNSSPEFHLYGYLQPKHYPMPNMDNSENYDFQTFGMKLHNLFRARHESPPLEIDQKLNSKAQKWADTLSGKPELYLASEPSLGQNVYISDQNNSFTAINDAIQFWYNVGLSNYNWTNVKSNWGNSISLEFSQIVWKSTRKLGLGASQGRNGTVIVAFYFPWGNIVLEDIEEPESLFLQNVLQPQIKS